MIFKELEESTSAISALAGSFANGGELSGLISPRLNLALRLNQDGRCE